MPITLASRFRLISSLLLFVSSGMLGACQPPTTISPSVSSPAPTAAISAESVITPTLQHAASSPPTALFDPALNKQAMRPEFAADVERVVAAGATQYQLDVTLVPDSFDNPAGIQLLGQAIIDYTNTEAVPLESILFRLYPNLIGYGGRMEINQVSLGQAPVDFTVEGKDSVLIVPLPEPLAPNEQRTLTIDYEALIPTQVEFGYNIFSYTDGVVALAGFYPAVAVYDARGWHTLIPPYYGDATYLDIALYQVELTVPETLVVAASGNTLETEFHGDGSKTLSIVSGPMRDFYIAMRADYEVVSDMVDDIVVNSYYQPEAAESGVRVLQYGLDSLRLFNQQFGPYPYAELDIVATPTRAGGIEYPGIIVIAQGLYGSNSGRFLQHVVGHEVAHQWWYGLVGNNQIEHPWLDESLTNYSTLLYWADAAGESVAETITENFYRQPYEQAQQQGRDRGVYGAVSSFNEADYGVIVYNKGPLFFLALHEEVGDERFYEIVQTYYSEYKYKIAEPDDLIDVVERVYGRSIAPLYETWIVGQ